MCTITINQKDLKAVAHAMAVNDIRYYLNGVCVETDGADVRLIATDGHRLHIVVCESDKMPTIERTQYILPDSLVKTIIKSKAPRGQKNPMVTLTFDNGKVAAALPDGSEVVSALVDGKFPDYRRVIPNNDSLGEFAPSVLNYKYVVDAYAGLNDYHQTRVYVTTLGIMMRGDDVAILSDGGFTVAIAPMKGNICNSIDSRIHN